MSKRTYTKGEERANTSTHALGILFGCVAGIYLLQQADALDNRWAVASVCVYLFGMIASYLTSTLYHAAVDPKRKARLRKFDHAAIYFHIAGTYTPFTLYLLKDVGAWGWLVFAVVWLFAIVGACMSFANKKTGSKVETLCYVLMGIVILAAIKPLADKLTEIHSIEALYWLIGGGVSYIVGAILYSFKTVKYMHSVFHLFVLGGSVCHVLAIAAIF